MLQPTGNAGEFVLQATGQTIHLTEWEETDIYDTCAIATGAEFENGKITFYQGTAGANGKTDLDTNVRNTGQLDAHQQFIVLRPGVQVLPAFGDAPATLADTSNFYTEGVIEFLKNRKPILSKRHMWGLSTGYGLVAYGLDVNTDAIVPTSLGVASPAAQPPLLVPFQLKERDSFAAVVEFPGSNAGVAFNGEDAPAYTTPALSENLAIRVVMHGFLKAPATN